MLRTQHIADASYWFDESSSWKTIQYDWNEIIQPISRNVHPPFYYIALKIWGMIWGNGPLSLRMFSVVCGVLTVLATYYFTLELFNANSLHQNTCSEKTAPLSETPLTPPARGRETALLTATFVAVSQLHVLLSLHARMYSLGTLLALICAMYVLRITRSAGTWWEWSVATISGLLLSLTHHFGIFTAGVIGLFLFTCLMRDLLNQREPARAKRLVIGSFISLWLIANVWAMWFPYFLAQRSQVTESYWTQPFSWEQLPRTCFILLSGTTASVSYAHWMWLAVVFWGVICGLLLTLKNQGATFCALAASFPIILAILYSVNVRSIFVVRYFIFAQLFLLIGWGVLLHHIHWKFPKLLLGLISVLWLSFWTGEHVFQRDWQCERSQLKDVANVLEDWRENSEIVIVATPVIYVTVLQYSLQYSGQQDDIYTLDRPNGFPHFQGAPLLNRNEYYSLARLRDYAGERLFTVDVYDLYGPQSEFTVPLPPAWSLVRQQWFEERHHQRCRIFLREYCRQPESLPLP